MLGWRSPEEKVNGLRCLSVGQQGGNRCWDGGVEMQGP